MLRLDFDMGYPKQAVMIWDRQLRERFFFFSFINLFKKMRSEYDLEIEEGQTLLQKIIYIYTKYHKIESGPRPDYISRAQKKSLN